MALNVTGDDGALSWDAQINDAQYLASLKRMQDRYNQYVADVSNKTNNLNSLFENGAKAVGAFFAFDKAKDFVQSLVQTRGEFQGIQASFETILKSKAQADKLMADSVQLAARTPFNLQDVAGGAKQLLAYGTAAKDIIPTISMLGDVASGIKAPIGDIIYLYGTLQTQGRAYTRDIQQFASRGIPIIKLLADQFGISERNPSLCSPIAFNICDQASSRFEI